ncbi:MAG: M12 family metallo-peptidase [Phycisphaerales bacterium]
MAISKLPFLAAGLCMSTSVAFPLAAASPSIPAPPGRADSDVRREQPITLDLTSIRHAASRNGEFSIRLFEGVEFSVRTTSFVERMDGLTIHGAIEGDPLGSCTITIQDHLDSGVLVSAGFWASRGVFGLVPTDAPCALKPGQVQVVARELAPSAVVRCAMVGHEERLGSGGEPMGRNRVGARQGVPARISSPADGAPAPQPRGNACEAVDDQSTLDVLVVYTADARAAAGGAAALQVRVQNAIDTMNGALVNSGLNTGGANRLQVALAGLIEITYPEQAPPPPNWLDHLVRVTDPDDGYADDVHTLRDQFHADTVCLVIDDARFTGGAGWWALWDESQAFTCCNWRGLGGGSLLLAHEVGHNFGCAHDYENDPTAPTFYGRGHYFSANGTSYGTIMSYPGEVHIQYYSNPLLSPAPGGEPIGAPLSDPRAAWSSRLIGQTRWTLTSYRASGRVLDCNGNGIADSADIAMGTSADTNSNCRPDECEERVYVDSDAPGEGDGTTWNTSAKHLANVLSFASLKYSNVREVWVADGVHAPDYFGAARSASRSAAFALRSGLGLYGGFQGRSRPGGGEASLAQRADPSLFPTVLSGEIGSAAGDDNSYSVVTAIDLTGSAVLDGFKIERGYADFDGGGLYARNARVAVTGCEFRNNRTGGGGGAALVDGSAGSFTDCVFRDNAAVFYGGGGIELYVDSTATVDRCEFRGNTGQWGGGASAGGGGCAFDIRSSVFSGNRATVYNGGALDVDNSGLTLANSLLYANMSQQDGGAVWTASNSDVSVVNCTIAGNAAGTFTGGLVAYFDDADIAGTIFWANTGIHSEPQGRQLVYFGATGAIRYSRVQDWSGSLGGPGNSGANPMFTSAAAGDYSLQAGSTCIDSGDTASLLALGGAPILLDVLGNVRRVDDPASADAGAGPAPLVDIGAAEFQPSACAADFNHDGGVNSQDFFDFIAAFFSGLPSADFNRDMVTNSQDFFDFLAGFFAGC